MPRLTIKNVAFVVFLLFSNTGWAWNQRPPMPLQQCAVHAPWGFVSTVKPLTNICREAYLVSYSVADKIPDHVSYTLTPNRALGCLPRTDAFVADASVAGGATPQDYVGTGYDKGHMAPDGDQSWNQQIEYESFLMTNMTPQAPGFNRGVWKLLETSIRGWVVQQNTAFTIISGAIYSAQDKTIGRGVRVPHAYYKIAINQSTGEVAAWRFPHVPPYPNLGNNLAQFRVPVAQVESEVAVKFQFPTNAQELPPGREWPVNFAQLTSEKRKFCGMNAN